MKPAVVRTSSQGGFSLVEAVLSIGIMSFGFLALVPLLALGMAGSRSAHATRIASSIAASYIEQAKQGTLVAGTSYLDTAGQLCGVSQAAYIVEEASSNVPNSQNAPGPLTRVTVKVSPRSSPLNKFTYVELVPTP